MQNSGISTHWLGSILMFGQHQWQFSDRKGLKNIINLVIVLLLFKSRQKPARITRHINRHYRGVVFADLCHQFEAVFSRHLDVCQNHIRPELQIGRISVLPIVGRKDPMIFLFYHHSEDSGHNLIVIDNQYLHFSSATPGIPLDLKISKATVMPTVSYHPIILNLIYFTPDKEVKETYSAGNFIQQKWFENWIRCVTNW